MKHKITYYVEVQKRGLFGSTKTVLEERTKWMSGREYRRVKKEQRNQPYTVEEMMFYDDIIYDEDL